MLDIKVIRENTDHVMAAMETLGADDAPVGLVVRLDERRRDILTRVEALRAERNAGSKRVGELMRDERRTEGEALRQHMSNIGDEIHTLDEELAEVEAALNDAMLRIPNLPHPSVPVGQDETENVVVRTRGRAAGSSISSRARTGTLALPGHHRLRARRQAQRQSLLCAEGSGRALAARADYVDAGPAHSAARLHRSLSAVHGAGPRSWWARATSRSSATISTTTPRRTSGGFPTAEVPVTNLYRDEILDGERLPICHVAYTPASGARR